MSEATHVPVLLAEVLDALGPRDGGIYVDATFGGGGYSRALLATVDCRVVAIDRDPEAVARGRELEREEPRFTMIEGRFGELDRLLAERGIGAVDGIVFDLGLSSFQLAAAERGFSFTLEGPLDMRMERRGPSAADLLARLREEEIARILRDYGEEPAARRIARAIVARRAQAPIRTTRELAELIVQVVGPGRRGHHPATRTFQALRIAVNDELGELERGLAAAVRVLRPGGRLVVVSFHSLEDRIVKRFVDAQAGRRPRLSRHLPEAGLAACRPTLRWVTRRVVRPSRAELARNPRARSARLRVAEKLAAEGESADRPPLEVAA